MKLEVPAALRRLIKFIKITTSKLEGGITSVAIADVDFSGSWVILPDNLMVEGTPSGAARVLQIHADEETRVICQVAQAGTHWHKKIITDAHEYIQVQEGRLLEYVTGTIIEPGKPMLVPAGQVNEYIALEDTFFTDTVKLTSGVPLPTTMTSKPSLITARQAPAALRKLLEKIKLTTSLIEGGVDMVPVRQIPVNYEWTQNPAHLLHNDRGESQFRVVHDEENLRVYAQYLSAGSTLSKKIIPDAHERITVATGSLLELATGRVITPGNDLVVPAGQVHQYTAQEHTVFLVTFKFIDNNG